MAYTSVVDYLNANGQDSSLSARAALAANQGLVSNANEYLTLASKGLNADINTKLLSNLQSGTPGAKTGSTTSFAGNAPVVTGGPITSSNLSTSYNLPEPTSFLSANDSKSMNDMIGEVAKLNITDSNRLAIDNLRSQLQTQTTTEKNAAQKEVDQYKKQLNDVVGSTATRDAFNAGVDEYKIKENLALYTDIQNRIVDAQKALDIGLIYEKDRPARMKFITGAESTLKQQGLATIGALQGTAAVIKGNIEIAKSLVDATVSAINTDNERSFKALTTLLDLANNNLVSLTEQERKLVNDRLTSIETGAADLQKKKDASLELMTKYPKAYLNGGVTLLDSYETALQKMLPAMAADEKAKFDADLAVKYKQANGSSGTDTAKTEQYKAQLLAAKNNGMTYNEAVLGFADVLPIDYINAIYRQGKTDSGAQDQITDSYYSQFLDENGNVKPGYTVSIDPKNGRPVVTPTKTEGDGFWSNIGQAFSSLFK